MVLSITVPCIGTLEMGWNCFDIAESCCSEKAWRNVFVLKGFTKFRSVYCTTLKRSHVVFVPTMLRKGWRVLGKQEKEILVQLKRMMAFLALSIIICIRKTQFPQYFMNPPFANCISGYSVSISDESPVCGIFPGFSLLFSFFAPFVCSCYTLYILYIIFYIFQLFIHWQLHLYADFSLDEVLYQNLFAWHVLLDVLLPIQK